MKTLVLYADWGEVKYISPEVKKRFGFLHIGVGAVNLEILKPMIREYDRVVLFGSCGLLTRQYCGWMICNNYEDVAECSGRCDYEECTIHNNDFIEPKFLAAFGLPRIELPFGTGTIFTALNTITTDYQIEQIKAHSPDVTCVDMESYHVAAFCKLAGVEFRTIRYIIDECSKRVMPRGINHFWRKYQHERMQRKFNINLF